MAQGHEFISIDCVTFHLKHRGSLWEWVVVYANS